MSSDVPRSEQRLKAAYEYRDLRLAEIASCFGGVLHLLDEHSVVALALRDLGWDDESIAFWLTSANAHLNGQVPAVLLRASGSQSHDLVLRAAYQRAHV